MGSYGFLLQSKFFWTLFRKMWVSFWRKIILLFVYNSGTLSSSLCFVYSRPFWWTTTCLLSLLYLLLILLGKKFFFLISIGDLRRFIILKDIEYWVTYYIRRRLLRGFIFESSVRLTRCNILLDHHSWLFML